MMEKLYAELINEKIEEKRQEMIRLAIDFGFTSQLAVQASQELDSLLNAAAFRDK
ncbi:aspartyl-phosphate phosphatase Spo0E family protein [Peribacillus asahii]|nr:aspartyl-phosphate phosphatase Spo0E family protein [Peribacillus asahii]